MELRLGAYSVTDRYRETATPRASFGFRRGGVPGAAFTFESTYAQKRKKAFGVHVFWDDVVKIIKLLADEGEMRARELLQSTDNLDRLRHRIDELCEEVDRLREERGEQRKELNRKSDQLTRIEAVLREGGTGIIPSARSP